MALELVVGTSARMRATKKRCWWADGLDASPYDAKNPLAANLNRAIATSVADPVSGSIPLRCSWCEVEKL